MQAINLEDIDRPHFVALDKEGQVILIAEVTPSGNSKFKIINSKLESP
jgi:hypothetical protein